MKPAELLLEHRAPDGVVALGLALALGLWAWSALRQAPRHRWSAAAAAARLLLLAGLGWTLLLPARRRLTSEPVLPRLAVALDTSASMALTPAGATVPSRWSAAQRILAAPWLRAAQSDWRVEVVPFDVEPGPALALAGAAELRPTGRATRLRESLRRIVEQQRGQRLAAVLLLSDGLDTQELRGDWAAEDWPCPILTVRLEPPDLWSAEPDARLEAADTPRRATVGWDTRLIVTVAGHGVAGRAFPLRIERDGRRLEEVPILLTEDGQTREVAVRLRHETVGTERYTISIPPLPGETHTEDNARELTVQTTEARQRLLYVEDLPRWESKFLIRELKANRETAALAIVRGPDGTFLSYGERGTATLELTEEQLRHFQIVVLGDFDAAALGPERAAALRAFVEQGGSLVLLGGPKAWGADGLASSALREALPFERPSAAPPAQGRFAAALTAEGRLHPVFAADSNGWERLPPLLSCYGGARPKPAATVLLEAQTPAGPQPVLLVQNYGQGKTAALLTDTLWRWQLEADAERPYARFWRNLVSWLTPARSALEPLELELTADRAEVFAGEALTLLARLGGAAAQTTAAKVVCEVQTPEGRRVVLNMTLDRDGREGGAVAYRAEFRAQTPGAYQAAARAEVDGAAAAASYSFQAQSAAAETLPRPSDERLLRTLAERSGGRWLEPDEMGAALAGLKPRVASEPRVEFESLWQRGGWLALLLGLLLAEWLARRLADMP